MLTPLRAEVNALLAQIPVRRKPALRRCDTGDALLATDLPFAAEEDAVLAFCAAAKAAGWQVATAENGWLLLDKAVPAPLLRMPAVLVGECGCCIALLARHPEAGETERLIRCIVTAEEAGTAALDRCCAALHERLAAMLRLHQPLPGALMPYLIHAYEKYSEGRTSL